MTPDSSAYLMIFRETAPERYQAMTADERRERLDAWNAWCERLAEQGRLQDGHPLEPEGRIVASARAGRPTDGPFAEAKEMIGGYFLVNAASLDEATAIAEESPNLPYGMTIEVRPVAQACHLARSLGMRTMREKAPLPSP